ncbi:MAG: phosphoadenosine phosphosulfate reductase family protein [Desulfurococcales archaeon]|nr:phosphoadenosine phosphosulfate reductase family protein [Desulfurococcales archaeon]
MLKILVRGRKDKAAVEKSIQLFYPGWDIAVESLGGVRGDKLVEKLEEINLSSFTILLSGRRDLQDFRVALNQLAPLPPLVALSLVDRSNVRNARLEMIAHSIDIGRAMLRGTTEWINNVYRFYFSLEGSIIKLPRDPESDNFFFFSQKYHSLPLKPDDAFVLAYKLREGLHEFYCGSERAGTARFSLTETKIHSWNNEAICPKLDENKLIEENQKLLEILENKALSFIRKNVPDHVEKIIVPWSGGKDSTAVLVLSIKALGKDRVIALHVDTGTEFPTSSEYIERVSRMLGVQVERVYAGLREAIGSRGLPQLGERWCTGLKLDALRRGIRDILKDEKPVVIVGDRDAESKLRVRRPQLRASKEETSLAPLKLWGGAHVQLYLKSRGIPLNPLYEIGFYRIGCFICPSLRDWEISIMLKRIDALKLGSESLLSEFFENRYGTSSLSK